MGLPGLLSLPDNPAGLVLFAHGSGSTRLSPRNSFVASKLHHAGLATLLFDLLTPQEERRDAHTLEYRFDIGLLTQRLEGATQWVNQHAALGKLSLGYFGASTGSAAALAAAAHLGRRVAAVVSRGGRPDLVPSAQRDTVSAAVLLIVGGNDEDVLALNRVAFEDFPAEKQLCIVPGASHLFEEPGAMEEVARLAADWFTKYLLRPAAQPLSLERP